MADQMDELLAALGRVIESRAAGKREQLREDLLMLAGVCRRWGVALTCNQTPEDNRG